MVEKCPRTPREGVSAELRVWSQEEEAMMAAEGVVRHARREKVQIV